MWIESTGAVNPVAQGNLRCRASATGRSPSAVRILGIRCATTGAQRHKKGCRHHPRWPGQTSPTARRLRHPPGKSRTVKEGLCAACLTSAANFCGGELISRSFNLWPSERHRPLDSFRGCTNMMSSRSRLVGFPPWRWPAPLQSYSLEQRPITSWVRSRLVADVAAAIRNGAAAFSRAFLGKS